MNKEISLRVQINKFKLKAWGLKDIALILLLMVVLYFFNLIGGFWGFVFDVFLVGLVLILLDKSIEKEVNDWLSSDKCKINIIVEKKR